MVLRALNDIWAALRSFDEQALTFASYAVFIYTFIIIVSNVYKRIKYKRCDKIWQMVLSICLFGILCIYLSYLVSLTLSGREAGSRSNKINLDLFGTWSADGSLSAHATENVLLFIPFGVLIPLFGHFFKKWWNLVLMAFISSMLIELTQLLTARGYFELDDIMLNTLGAFIGYLIFWIIYHSYLAFKKEAQIPLSKQEIMVNRVTLFIIQLMPVVFMLMLIFRFSTDDGNTSGELSMFATEKLLYIVNKVLRLGMTAEKISIKAVDVEGNVRTLAHMVEYAMLSFFTFVFLYCRRLSNSFSFIFTFVFTFITACIDEYCQRSVEGRYSSIADVGVDCLASLAVLILIFMILVLIRYNNKNRKIKQKFRIFK